jgi:hypothetical protein
VAPRALLIELPDEFQQAVFGAVNVAAEAENLGAQGGGAHVSIPELDGYTVSH